MKKYLMMGTAVLALSAAFVSCSKDKDLYEPFNESLIKAEYTAAFEKTFGQPAANQNWGFGAVRLANATRAIQPSFNFPSDADASKFLADVPEGIELLAPGIGKANHYIDASYTGELNVWGIGTAENGWVAEGGTLYVKGNCDFSSRRFYFAGNSELYLVEGATLTLSAENSGNLQTNCNIYIAEGAKLVANGELKLNNGLHIYNHGTIEAPSLSTNSNSWLVNAGTVTVDGKISVENTESVIENNGTITAKNLNTAGSGKFENNATVEISGNTVVNSNDNTWVNNGQYHTGYFYYHAASDEVINNCKLTVDEDFNINLGDNPGNGNFKMDAGSGVITKNFNGGGKFNNANQNWVSYNGGPFYIYMGAASVFKVTGTATMNATKADYGIYGPESGDYAVFQANKIVAGAANQGYEVTYGGNLYVYAEESHFANGMSGQYPYIDFKGNAKIYASGFESGKPAVTIEETECNPGFSGGIVPPPSEGPSLCVLAEDLCAKEPGEFDFNDVVIDVYYESSNEVKIILRAAGGTVPLRICGNTEWEVHKLFDVDTKCMVNTGSKYHVAKSPYSQATKPYVELSYTGYSGWSEDQDEFNSQVNHQIKLEVASVDDDDNILGWTELKAEVGKAAQKVAMPVDAYVDGWYTPGDEHWAWEKQYVGDGFKQWVIGQSESFYKIRQR